MEKSRKLEFTKLFSNCVVNGQSSTVGILRAHIELHATPDEMKEFLELPREEHHALHDEITKNEITFTMQQIKMGAILRNCLRLDVPATECMKIMKELMNVDEQECAEFMEFVSDKHEQLFAEVDRLTMMALKRMASTM